jgi:hypothetical protein
MCHRASTHVVKDHLYVFGSPPEIRSDPSLTAAAQLTAHSDFNSAMRQEKVYMLRCQCLTRLSRHAFHSIKSQPFNINGGRDSVLNNIIHT